MFVMNDKVKLKILIVDDVPANIKVLWEIIKTDYTISVTTNGTRCLEIVRSETPPDLILLDIMMPNMDGYQVCQVLKADPQTSSIPIIFITALSGAEDEAKGFKLGAVDYIVKPFNPAIVKARVKTHLELKQYRDSLEKTVAMRTNELLDTNRQLLKDISERKRAENLLKQAREEEVRLLEMTTDLSFELNLGRLLTKIMDTTKELLNADRCTLFLYDTDNDELWSQVAQGMDTQEIRFPRTVGIAGSVFQVGETVNIADAYSDDRFNPAVDQKTGYKTNSILCMPVNNKKGRTIGVTQVLNKKGGPFTTTDERRLRAFSAQATIALENARLFEDVVNMKNYNESLLESMSNGLIALGADQSIVKCNSKALTILKATSEDLVGQSALNFFKGPNVWVADNIKKVISNHCSVLTVDTDIILQDKSAVSINLNVVPLLNVQKEFNGCLLVIEDITTEKRLRGTMARYMTKEVADQLMEDGETALGGRLQEATILFTDIRNFTGISEVIGPQESVSLLNQYFSFTVDIIFRYKGILDKYIGDAIMAVFGAPFATGHDSDHAVQSAIDIMRALKEFNRQRIHDGHDPVYIGTGIATDEVLSGNIGSEKRMDYTVIGDGVNLASRLESANKAYGTRILISEFTYKHLKKDYQCREIDLIRVKGKQKPVSIYEILDFHDHKTFPAKEQTIDLFNQGLKLYRRQTWKQARHLFNKIIQKNPKDKVAKLYRERCQHFAQNPPPGDWDTVWVMQSK